MLALSVGDSGICIPAEKQGRVMQKFERGRNLSGRGPGTGAGLGLNLAKSIVELHGGNVLIDWTVDVGTTITSLMPVVALIADALAAGDNPQ
jgi:signal transduction histidine kinase